MVGGMLYTRTDPNWSGAYLLQVQNCRTRRFKGCAEADRVGALNRYLAGIDRLTMIDTKPFNRIDARY
jgi:hypothetical protein